MVINVINISYFFVLVYLAFSLTTMNETKKQFHDGKNKNLYFLIHNGTL